jgi:hypothetical protein
LVFRSGVLNVFSPFIADSSFVSFMSSFLSCFTRITFFYLYLKNSSLFFSFLVIVLTSQLPSSTLANIRLLKSTKVTTDFTNGLLKIAIKSLGYAILSVFTVILVGIAPDSHNFLNAKVRVHRFSNSSTVRKSKISC